MFLSIAIVAIALNQMLAGSPTSWPQVGIWVHARSLVISVIGVQGIYLIANFVS